MSLPRPLDALEQQHWTDPAADAVQQAVARVYDLPGPAAQKTRNLLHGTWLGHPLHPVLTDLPIGAWSTALALDVADAAGAGEGLGSGADGAILVGLLAALPTAVTGLADWRHTSGHSRRVGLLHGVSNGTALALHGLSLLLRRRGARRAGMTASFLGFAALMVGAYLGGHLVYNARVGTDHSARHSPPEEWTPVLEDADLREGEARRVEAGGAPVLLARQGGRVHALIETCAHRGGPLSQGKIENGTVVCPWHGSRYCLADGRVLEGPSAYPQPRLSTRVRDGRIEVRG